MFSVNSQLTTRISPTLAYTELDSLEWTALFCMLRCVSALRSWTIRSMLHGWAETEQNGTEPFSSIYFACFSVNILKHCTVLHKRGRETEPNILLPCFAWLSVNIRSVSHEWIETEQHVPFPYISSRIGTHHSPACDRLLDMFQCQHYKCCT